MGEVRISYKLCNPQNPELCAEIKDALVDTGSSYNLVPRSILEKIGVKPIPKKVDIELGTGQVIKSEIALAVCEVNGRVGPCPVIPTEEQVEPLFGVLNMEAMGMRVDPSTGQISFKPLRL